MEKTLSTSGLHRYMSVWASWFGVCGQIPRGLFAAANSALVRQGEDVYHLFGRR